MDKIISLKRVSVPLRLIHFEIYLPLNVNTGRTLLRHFTAVNRLMHSKAFLKPRQPVASRLGPIANRRIICLPCF